MGRSPRARKGNSTVRVLVSKFVRRPLPETFAWCTDYRDTDPELSRIRLRTRKILRRTETEVEMDETGRMGFPYRAHFLVRLHPPDRWVADAASNMGSSHIEYRLMPQGNGTRIELAGEVHLRGPYRLVTPFAGGFFRRKISAEWDDYVGAMESGR